MKHRGDSGRQELQQGLPDQPTRSPSASRARTSRISRSESGASTQAGSHSHRSLHGLFAPTPHLRSFKLAARSPQARTHLFSAQPPTPLRLDHESCAVMLPFPPARKHLPSDSCTSARCLCSALGRPRAVALGFVCCNQITMAHAPRSSAATHAAQPRKRAAPGSPFLLASQGLNRAISSRRPP